MFARFSGFGKLRKFCAMRKRRRRESHSIGQSDFTREAKKTVMKTSRFSEPAGIVTTESAVPGVPNLARVNRLWEREVAPSFVVPSSQNNGVLT